MLLQRNALADTNKNRKISLKDSQRPAFEYDNSVGFLSILTYQLNQQQREIKIPAPSPPPQQENKLKPRVPRFRRMMIESVYGSTIGSPKSLPKKTATSPQPQSKSQTKSERKIYRNLSINKSKLLSQNSLYDEKPRNNSGIILSKEKQLITLYTPKNNLKKPKHIIEIKPKIREDDIYGLQSLLNKKKDKLDYFYKKYAKDKISLSVEKTLDNTIPIYDVNFKEKYEF